MASRPTRCSRSSSRSPKTMVRARACRRACRGRHPRGELIALQMAPPTPERTRRAKAIIEHRARRCSDHSRGARRRDVRQGLPSRATLKSPRATRSPTDRGDHRIRCGRPSSTSKGPGIARQRAPGDAVAALARMVERAARRARDSSPGWRRLSYDHVDDHAVAVLTGKGFRSLRELDVAARPGRTRPPSPPRARLLGAPALRGLAKLELRHRAGAIGPGPPTVPSMIREQWAAVRPLFEVAAKLADHRGDAAARAVSRSATGPCYYALREGQRRARRPDRHGDHTPQLGAAGRARHARPRRRD